MRIVSDRSKCEGIGMCEATADDFFQVGDDGFVEILRDEVPGDRRAYIQAAIDACPVSALRLVD